MDIWEALKRQRVKHIITSYQLDGAEPEPFADYLNGLFSLYSPSLIELALAETLLNEWLNLPTLRGCDFLARAHHRIQQWETCPIALTITPAQFQQITGLTPDPIFSSSSTSFPVIQ